jgi:hypothetical protein
LFRHFVRNGSHTLMLCPAQIFSPPDSSVTIYVPQESTAYSSWVWGIELKLIDEAKQARAIAPPKNISIGCLLYSAHHAEFFQQAAQLVNDRAHCNFASVPNRPSLLQTSLK